MKKLLRRLRRALRRRNPDIVAVMCPLCRNMMPAYERHYCPQPIIIEIGEMRGHHIFKR